MQLVVVMAVRKAVSAATTTFTAISIIRFFIPCLHLAHVSEANTLPIDVYANDHKKAPIEVTLLFIVKS